MKLTKTQKLVLRNVRDHGFHAATGFLGMSARGGAAKSVDSLRARGLVDGPHRSEHLTEEGKQVLLDVEIADHGMTNTVRRALRGAAHFEARGGNLWGYSVATESTPGVVRVSHTPKSPGVPVKVSNEKVSEYVRTLQQAGFVVRRVLGGTEVDRLLITRKDSK